LYGAAVTVIKNSLQRRLAFTMRKIVVESIHIIEHIEHHILAVSSVVHVSAVEERVIIPQIAMRPSISVDMP
jgi:hypothetical protein